MGEKPKKILSSSYRLTRKHGFFFKIILFLAFLGLITPIYYIQAGGIDYIVGLGEDVWNTFWNFILGAILQIIATIGDIFLGIAAGLLGWITKGFTSLSYTNAGLLPSASNYNPVVGIGWHLARDLTNSFMILVVVILALTIALRAKEGFIVEALGMTDTDAKKYLGRLIIIAFLINFTPVICGLVVDAGNILMNFFIKDLTGWNAISNIMDTQVNSLNSLIDNPTSYEFLGKSIGIAAFNFLGAAILFLYVALFILRYIAIWVLVIISPLAFLASIIPATKKIFIQWWNQFIQWTFIGAVAGFFLYIGYNILYIVSSPNNKLRIATGAGQGIKGGGFIDSILPYFVVIAFLYIGFFVAISTNAAGASGIISGAQKGFKKMGTWVGRSGWKRTKSAAARAVTLRRQPPLPKEEIAKMKGRRELWGYRIRRGLSVATGMDIAAPYAFQTRRAEIARAEKEAEKISDPLMLKRHLENPLLSVNDKIGGATVGAKRGGAFKKAVEEALGRKGIIKLASEANAIKAGAQAGIIGRGFINDVDKMGFTITDEDRERWRTEEEKEKGIKPDDKEIIQRKLAGPVKKEQIEQLGKDFISSDIGKKIMANFWGGPQLGAVAQEFGRIAVDNINKNFKDIEMKEPGWFKKYNSKIPRYFSHTPAQDLGYDPKIFITPKSTQKTETEKVQEEREEKKYPGRG